MADTAQADATRAKHPDFMKNLVILISGTGSNMAAIVRAAQAQRWGEHLDARVVAVISNRPDAKGLAFAREHKLWVRPHCSFFRAYIAKRPELHDLVHPDERAGLAA